MTGTTVRGSPCTVVRVRASVYTGEGAPGTNAAGSSLNHTPTSEQLDRTACESGGTGRRAGFRFLWGNPWGFESPLSHSLLCRRLLQELGRNPEPPEASLREPYGLPDSCRASDAGRVNPIRQQRQPTSPGVDAGFLLVPPNRPNDVPVRTRDFVLTLAISRFPCPLSRADFDYR